MNKLYSNVFSEYLYKRIYSNIYRGWGFKVKYNKIFITSQYDLNYDIKSHNSQKMVCCLTNISYNMFNNNVPFTYLPMNNIYDGWCSQNENDKDIWTIVDKDIQYYDEADVITTEKSNKISIDYIPCFDIEKQVEMFEYGNTYSFQRDCIKAVFII